MNDLLSDRAGNEAYLLAEPGRQYAVYFPAGGSATLKMTDSGRQWKYRWINPDSAEWSESGQIKCSKEIRLTAPAGGHWIVVLLPAPVVDAREAGSNRG